MCVQSAFYRTWHCTRLRSRPHGSHRLCLWGMARFFVLFFFKACLWNKHVLMKQCTHCCRLAQPRCSTETQIWLDVTGPLLKNSQHNQENDTEQKMLHVQYNRVSYHWISGWWMWSMRVFILSLVIECWKKIFFFLLCFVLSRYERF